MVNDISRGYNDYRIRFSNESTCVDLPGPTQGVTNAICIGFAVVAAIAIIKDIFDN